MKKQWAHLIHPILTPTSGFLVNCGYNGSHICNLSPRNARFKTFRSIELSFHCSLPNPHFELLHNIPSTSSPFSSSSAPHTHTHTKTERERERERSANEDSQKCQAFFFSSFFFILNSSPHVPSPPDVRVPAQPISMGCDVFLSSSSPRLLQSLPTPTTPPPGQFHLSPNTLFSILASDHSISFKSAFHSIPFHSYLGFLLSGSLFLFHFTFLRLHQNGLEYGFWVFLHYRFWWVFGSDFSCL